MADVRFPIISTPVYGRKEGFRRLFDYFVVAGNSEEDVRMAWKRKCDAESKHKNLAYPLQRYTPEAKDTEVHALPESTPPGSQTSGVRSPSDVDLTPSTPPREPSMELVGGSESPSMNKSESASGNGKSQSASRNGNFETVEGSPKSKDSKPKGLEIQVGLSSSFINTPPISPSQIKSESGKGSTKASVHPLVIPEPEPPKQEPYRGEIKQDFSWLIELRKPKIISRCPIYNYYDPPFEPGITAFAFPMGYKYTSLGQNPKCYSFVMTTVDGTKQYGSCLRFHEIVLLEEGKDGEDDLTVAIPKALIITSHHPYLNQMEDMLRLVYRISICKRHPNDIERIIWLMIRDTPLPIEANNRLNFNMHNQTITFCGPAFAEKLPLLSCKFSLLFEFLSHDHIIALVTLLLQETKLVLVSKYCSVLVHCAESLKALIYPLKWMSVYIPLLPMAARDVLLAPVPFFVGLTSELKEDLEEPLGPDIAMMDIDKGVLELPSPPPAALPAKIRERMMNTLLIHDSASRKTKSKGVFNSSRNKRCDDAFPYGTESIRLDQQLPSPQENIGAKHKATSILKIRGAFLKMLSEMFLGFKRFIVASAVDIQHQHQAENALFKDTAFVRSRPYYLRSIMRKIVQTMAFGEFIQHSYAKPTSYRVVSLMNTIMPPSKMNPLQSLGKLWTGTEEPSSMWENKMAPNNEDEWFEIDVPIHGYLKKTSTQVDFEVKDPRKTRFPKLDKTKFFGPEKKLSFSRHRSMGFAFLVNRVELINPNSPAEIKGVKVGWLIMSVDGRQAPVDQRDLMKLIIRRRSKRPNELIELSFSTETEIGKAQTPLGEADILSVVNENGVSTLRFPFGVGYIHFSNLEVDFKESRLQDNFFPYHETKDEPEEKDTKSEGIGAKTAKSDDVPDVKAPRQSIVGSLEGLSGIRMGGMIPEEPDIKTGSSQSTNNLSELVGPIPGRIRRRGRSQIDLTHIEGDFRSQTPSPPQTAIAIKSKYSNYNWDEANITAMSGILARTSIKEEDRKVEDTTSKSEGTATKIASPRSTPDSKDVHGREVKIAFQPGKLGFYLNGNAVSRVQSSSQAMFKGVEVGMMLISINGRQAINDSESNFSMIEAVQRDPTTQLVLKFYRPTTKFDHLQIRSRDDSMLRDIFQSKRHSAETVQYSKGNPYLKYIKSVAANTFNKQRRRRTSRRNTFSSEGIIAMVSTPHSPAHSDNDDDGSSALPGHSEIADDNESSRSHTTSFSSTAFAQSGRRVHGDNDGRQETYIVVFPQGVKLTQEVNEESEVIDHLAQGTRVVSDSRRGRRIHVTLSNQKTGWVSQYRPDMVPLLIATRGSIQAPEDSGKVRKSEKDLSEMKAGGDRVGVKFKEEKGRSKSVVEPKGHKRRGSKWVKWLKRKIKKNERLKMGDRVRMKRKTRKLQRGQVGTVANDMPDKNGNWFVDFISLDDEVERWALPPQIVDRVQERVDQTLVVQFRPDKKVGMAFNDKARVTQVRLNSLVLSFYVLSAFPSTKFFISSSVVPQSN